MEGILAGRYRLERQLGQGGMGSVWLAEHLALRSHVAVKLMDPAIAATPEGAERFRREAQAAASLRSAHVVQVLDYGVDGETPFLVMELLQGENLATCLEREKRLTPERTLSIVTQVSRALTRAHGASIVHRDLKPENIFLVREDDQELVKLLDFGIAKTPNLRFGGAETKTGVTMGTPYYMSPEQVQGKKVDQRADLWAVGVIACECMTGVRPFEGASIPEIVYNICVRPTVLPSSYGLSIRGFDEWFAKATNREPALRHASAQELAAALREVLAPAAPRRSAAIPETVVDPSLATLPLHRHARRNALLVLAGAGTVAAVAAWARWSPKPEPATTALVASANVPTSATAEPSAAPVATATVVSPPAALQQRVPSSPTVHSAPATVATAHPRERQRAAEPPPIEPLPTQWSEPPAGVTSVRCYLDPFSGRVRLAGAANIPGGASTFACKQDPFTGQYRRQ
jgi:serine/threonine-protein kinase